MRYVSKYANFLQGGSGTPRPKLSRVPAPLLDLKAPGWIERGYQQDLVPVMAQSIRGFQLFLILQR